MGIGQVEIWANGNLGKWARANGIQATGEEHQKYTNLKLYLGKAFILHP